jgi:hypothetical protein
MASLLMLTTSLAADDQTDLQKSADNLDRAARTAEGRQRVLAEIAKETNLPVSTLETQQAATKFGFGELLIANKLAAATGKTFNELAALRTAGKGWGEIAKDNGVKLGEIVSAAHRAEQAVEHAGNHDKDRGPPAGAGRGNGPGGPPPGSPGGGRGGGGRG